MAAPSNYLRGKLTLTVHSGENLCTNPTNAYCCVRISSNKLRSLIVPGGQNPCFEHTFMLKLDHQYDEIIAISVYSKHAFLDEKIGKLSLPLAKLCSMAGRMRTFQLVHPHKFTKTTGNLKMSIQYTPAEGESIGRLNEGMVSATKYPPSTSASPIPSYTSSRSPSPLRPSILSPPSSSSLSVNEWLDPSTPQLHMSSSTSPMPPYPLATPSPSPSPPPTMMMTSPPPSSFCGSAGSIPSSTSPSKAVPCYPSSSSSSASPCTVRPVIVYPSPYQQRYMYSPSSSSSSSSSSSEYHPYQSHDDPLIEKNDRYNPTNPVVPESVRTAGSTGSATSLSSSSYHLYQEHSSSVSPPESSSTSHHPYGSGVDMSAHRFCLNEMD